MNKQHSRPTFFDEAVANMIIAYAPLIMGFIVAILFSKAMANPTGFGRFVFAMFIFGFVLFLVAKIINFKRGIIFSFGSKSMSPGQRLIYRIGYGFMIFGFIGIIVVAPWLRFAH